MDELIERPAENLSRWLSKGNFDRRASESQTLICVDHEQDISAVANELAIPTIPLSGGAPGPFDVVHQTDDPGQHQEPGQARAENQRVDIDGPIDLPIDLGRDP